MHRIAFWLFVIYLLLSFGRALPGQGREIFEVLSFFTLLLLIGFCIPLLWRWVFGRLLWKVRNRLVVTYLLMGLAPVVLFVALASIMLYVFAGQFAIFAASTELTSELGDLSAANQGFTTHILHSIAVDPKRTSIPVFESSENAEMLKGTSVMAFEDGRPLTLTPESPATKATVIFPEWLKKNYSGVVLENGQLYLRAVNVESLGDRQITAVTSRPLHRENLDQIAHGLGEVSLIPGIRIDDDDDNASHAKGRTEFRFQPEGTPVNKAKQDTDKAKQDAKEVEMVEARRSTVSGGNLPPAQNLYDIPVTFLAPLDVMDWATGKPHSTYAQVTSRPSLLYRRLFITSVKIAAIIQDGLIGVAIAFGVIELFAFVMAVRLNRTITASVDELYGATTAIDRGQLSHRITVKRTDQLASLSRSFNTMATSLERLLEEQREKQRLQSELQIAQEVQANLFPRGNVQVPKLELHGACYPARTVSGDYYDFLVFGGSSVGLAIGDISGKGISAALLMATLHSAVRAYRFAGEELVTPGVAATGDAAVRDSDEEEGDCGELFEEPAKILALLNRHLYRSTQPEKYATLWLGHYEGASRRLIYSNGGQLPPLLLRADDSVKRLDCGGTVVGLLNNMSYEQASEQLEPGDILIAYSDGVTEPENEFGEFGEERLLEVVRRHRHLSLAAISEQVMVALRSWIGGQEQPDDITLVLARQQ
ncbi:PP2C family protein-serine/threonine phosphatase [Silvibacterium sp.]|uniref:PP2C family protein-serine/threonine phosphatase n=1 Tax=Silvibacterium sp. TaxID=1964179 RepID=UPI0039E63581